MSKVDSIAEPPVERRPSEDYESWGQPPASYYDFKVEGRVMRGVLIPKMHTTASGITANQPVNATYFLFLEEHKSDPDIAPDITHEEESAEPEIVPVVKTDLGQRLQAARAKIIASGLPMFNSDELEQEIADRRGGHQ